jgi:oxygen-independent coproporphyrinogen-3 oxidase
MARSAGIARQSIDLIFGIPGQTLDEWRDDLRRALDAGTEHLSCYGLTYEPGTAMTARRGRGEFTPIDEDVETDMFLATIADLKAAGLDRYEVSNFARPGAESVHNLAYWRQENWLAAGPAASGHLAGRRWKNVARLDDYLADSGSGFSPIVDVELPEPRRALVESVMTGLRLSEGLDEQAVLGDAHTIDAAIEPRWSRARSALRARGLVEADADRIRLTDNGFLLANRVILELTSAIDPG